MVFVGIAAVASLLTRADSKERSGRIILSGQLFRVCAVVYEDFAKHLRSAKPERFSGEARDLVIWESDIANYDVSLERQRNGYYTVTLTVRNAPDMEIFGGGAIYKVRPDDMTIVSRRFPK